MATASPCMSGKPSFKGMRMLSGTKGRYGGKEYSEMPTDRTAMAPHAAHQPHRGLAGRPGRVALAFVAISTTFPSCVHHVHGRSDGMLVADHRALDPPPPKKVGDSAQDGR